ncbi:Radical SAM domain protein [Methanobacterium lacus]|uniref:Radical SAM domain protein n=1 Tax=Methanobacterium lacus (strain AL-21) TaxID=877455 RepID=F0TCM4_METLA|nr:radical SAM/SPASM domain-containing protein [Methanobacterium lacus]ADZ09301.1 Radical SAM domain protein [Methanobacterium lacus]
MENCAKEKKSDMDIGDMIRSFEAVANNPFSKFIISRTFDYCEKDHGNRLEVGLELLFNKRKTACIRCKGLSKMLSFIINKGVKTFGVTDDDLKELMEDPYWIKGLSSVIKGIGEFGVKKPFVPGAPFQVVWNITKSCNMNCAHCYENAGKKADDELNSEQIKQCLETLSRSGVTSIAFSGGEPTTKPNIRNHIKDVADLGIYPAMATNGYSLSNKKLCDKYVDSGLQFVQISLDGLNPETHDKFRGIDGAWERAVQAIKNFVEEDIFVEVSTTVTQHNIDEIPSMINFVRELGAHWLMLYNFIPTGNGLNISEMDISPQKRFNMLKTAYNENFKGDMQVLSTAPQYASVAESLQNMKSSIIPTHFYNPEYENPQIMQLAEFVGGCGAGRFYMSLEPNGDMYPCVFFPHDEFLRLGNILEDDFEEIWQNQPLLNDLRNKTLLEENCGSCDNKNICGGCRARAYTYLDNVQAPDPGCINNQVKWDGIRTKTPENISNTEDKYVNSECK